MSKLLPENTFIRQIRRKLEELGLTDDQIDSFIRWAVPQMGRVWAWRRSRD